MPSPAPSSPVTARAVAIGLVLAVGLNLVMDYNDFYLRNTLLMGNHFPVVGMAVLLALVLGVNVGARRAGRSGLSQGEMLLIWSMIGVAGSVGTTGLLRYIPGWAAAPAYYTTPGNDYRTYLLDRLPDWMLVSKKPDDPAVRWYFEGLPAGKAIPWSSWLRPMAAWTGFGVLLFAAVFVFASFFYRQWADRERLVFAVTYLPIEMTRPAPAGRFLNEFLSTPLVWYGAAVPILVHGLNGLRVYWPGLPAVPLTWSGSGLFPDRPWSELDLQSMSVFFSIIGVTFLLTTEVSFSIWFFYVLFRLSFVFVAWLGAGATGYWGNWWQQQPVFQTAGAMLTVSVFLFWSARGALRSWWGRVLHGGPDASGDPVPARLALLLLVAGLAGPVLWLRAAGVTWGWAGFAVLLFLSAVLVLTRIVAEAGLFFVGTATVPADVAMGIGNPDALAAGGTLAGLVMVKGALMQDLREILLPYVMHGLRVADAVRQSLRRVLGVLALTAAVAIAAALYARIATAYKYGGVNGDDWGHINSESDYLGSLVSFGKVPPAWDRITVGGVPLLPVGLAHVLTGAAVAAALLVLRARVPWWPLHPAGFVLCGSYELVLIWFSIFLGWAAKASIMRFGGATAYRRILPFFLGLILGESLIAVCWTCVSFVTGRPGLYILPG